jgi:hypothetical protein
MTGGLIYRNEVYFDTLDLITAIRDWHGRPRLRRLPEDRNAVNLARRGSWRRLKGPIDDLHNRMPVMLAADGFEPWLAEQDPSVAPRIDDAVEIKPVSAKMNTPCYDAPDCSEALVSPAQ